MSAISSLSAPYKHLYEIRNIKEISIDKNTGNIENISFTEGLVNHYLCGTKVLCFIEKNKVLIMSTECPEDIIDLLSYDELQSILSTEEFDDYCQKIMEKKQSQPDTVDIEPTTKILYSDLV